MHVRHVLVLGGDLDDARTLGAMTRSRVHRAVAYIQEHTAVRLYAAAGIYAAFPDMEKSMAVLMAQEAQKEGVHLEAIGPDPDFNTRGELRVFMEEVTDHSRAVISTWWHLPRVKRIIAQHWGVQTARSFEYVPAPGDLTPRLAFLEAIKWLLTFTPESVRSVLVNSYRALFGRSSW